MKGLVNVPVADLRREPTFQSERVSQALFNTPVELGEEKENYVSAALPDGYAGWMQKSHLFYPVSKTFSDRRLKVATPFLPVLAPDKKKKISVLTFSTAVRVFRQSGGWISVGSDEKVVGWVKKDGLTDPAKIRFSIDDLIRKGMEFFGTPYLWGGISSFGFDCSGFLFTLSDFFDQKIPRDTREQVKMGAEIPFEKIRPGDFLFFPGHVAIYYGQNKILHANLRGGGVTLDSIRKSDKSYNPVIENLVTIKRMW
ncbi:MAG: NlpC/P60 family protein [candidate division Zixibacteria bacterium]|nr:NlpC/P60 family protein [candidate division Zixibacteria bacterium]MCI0596511.1 NlpC/P60 family protein [candidate division Zixibacteria bacterium]